MSILLCGLPLVIGYPTRLAFVFVNRGGGVFGSEPVLKRSAFQWNLIDIEGLPPIRFVVTSIAFNRDTVHAKEHVDYRARMAAQKGPPADLRLNGHGRILRSSLHHVLRIRIFIKGFVKVVEKIDQIFVTVILLRATKVLINRVSNSVLNHIQKSHGSDVGRSVS